MRDLNPLILLGLLGMGYVLVRDNLRVRAATQARVRAVEAMRQ